MTLSAAVPTLRYEKFVPFAATQTVSPSTNPRELKAVDALLALAEKKGDQKKDKKPPRGAHCLLNFPPPPLAPSFKPLLQKQWTWPIIEPNKTAIALIQIQLERIQNKTSISSHQLMLICAHIRTIINTAPPADCERPFFNLVEKYLPKLFSKTHAFLDIEKGILQLYIKDEKLTDNSFHKISEAISIALPLRGGQIVVKRCHRIIKKIEVPVHSEWQLVKIKNIASRLNISQVYDAAFYEGKDKQSKCVIYGIVTC